METKLNISNPEVIEAAIKLTGASLLGPIAELPGVQGNQVAVETIIGAGQLAYAAAYKWVYYVSIGKFESRLFCSEQRTDATSAFGGVSILAALLLGDIGKYMGETGPCFNCGQDADRVQMIMLLF